VYIVYSIVGTHCH